MPAVNIEGVGKVNFPDDYTPERIKFAIENDILPRLKNEPKRDLVKEGALQAAGETPTWKKGLVSLGAGLTDVGQGIGQLARHGAELIPGVNAGAAEYDAKVANEKKIRDTYEEATPGGTIGRVTGAALPTLLIPAGSAASGAGAVVSKVAPKVGAAIADSAMVDAALTGAVQGGVMATGEGETHLGNAAKGAAGAAGTVGALNVIGAAAAPVIKKIANTVNPVTAKGGGMVVNGELTPQVVRALEKEGIDVPSLTAEARDRLLAMAKDAVAGSPVTPKELARAARLKSLPVPIDGTKGQLTKDFAQNQLEQSLAKSSGAGGPLREAFATQDEKLGANLDAFGQRTGTSINKTGDAAMADMGRSVEASVQARIDKSKANINTLYRNAEKQGETMAPVNATPLVQWLAEHEPEAISSPAINSIKASVEKIAKKDTFGQPQVTINDLENIYKKAGTLGNDSTAGHFMGEVKKVINQMTEGAGGEAYQAARKARLDHAMQFEEPGVIQNVVGMKSRTDRSVPYEGVFKKTVINGSIDDLKTLKGTLLANDKDTREAGVQAFKDMRGQAMQFLKDAATNNAHGDTSEAALRSAYNQIGPEKMRELFGGNTAKQFENFMEAVKDLKVAPKGTQNPSGTAGEIVNWVERILSPLTMTGRLGRAAVSGASKLAEGVQSAGKVAEAVNPMAGNEAARAASISAQQNERLRALLDKPLSDKLPSVTLRKIRALMGAGGAAAASQ